MTDRRVLFDQGVELYRATISDWLKWGKGAFAERRLAGESSETLRDFYHSAFGFGSLLQAAEAAWGQDVDLFGEGGAALAATLELHARLLNAALDRDSGALPPGFKFYADIPKAPAGCAWRWDGDVQLWPTSSAS